MSVPRAEHPGLQAQQTAGHAQHTVFWAQSRVYEDHVTVEAPLSPTSRSANHCSGGVSYGCSNTSTSLGCNSLMQQLLFILHGIKHKIMFKFNNYKYTNSLPSSKRIIPEFSTINSSLQNVISGHDNGVAFLLHIDPSFSVSKICIQLLGLYKSYKQLQHYCY